MESRRKDTFTLQNDFEINHVRRKLSRYTVSHVWTTNAQIRYAQSDQGIFCLLTLSLSFYIVALHILNEQRRPRSDCVDAWTDLVLTVHI